MTTSNNKASDNNINGAVQILERRDLDLVTDIDLTDYAKSGSSAAWGGAQFEFLRVRNTEATATPLISSQIT